MIDKDSIGTFCDMCWTPLDSVEDYPRLVTEAQIASAEFAAWLESTSFAGQLEAGEQWDTPEAWPSEETMRAARECFAAFERGDRATAEQRMHDAQRAFV